MIRSTKLPLGTFSEVFYVLFVTGGCVLLGQYLYCYSVPYLSGDIQWGSYRNGPSNVKKENCFTNVLKGEE